MTAYEVSILRLIAARSGRTGAVAVAAAGLCLLVVYLFLGWVALADGYGVSAAGMWTAAVETALLSLATPAVGPRAWLAGLRTGLGVTALALAVLALFGPSQGGASWGHAAGPLVTTGLLTLASLAAGWNWRGRRTPAERGPSAAHTMAAGAARDTRSR